MATFYPGDKVRASFLYYNRGFFGALTRDTDRVQLRPGRFDPSNAFQIVEQNLRVFRSTIRFTDEQFAQYLTFLQSWIGWPVAYDTDADPQRVGVLFSATRETVDGEDLIAIQIAATPASRSALHLDFRATRLDNFYVITESGRTDSDGTVQPTLTQAQTAFGQNPGSLNRVGLPGITGLTGRTIDRGVDFEVTLYETNASVLNETGDVVLDAQEIVEGILHCEFDIMPFFGADRQITTQSQGQFATNHMYLLVEDFIRETVTNRETSYSVERIRKLDSRRYEVRLVEDIV